MSRLTEGWYPGVGCFYVLRRSLPPPRLPEQQQPTLRSRLIEKTSGLFWRISNPHEHIFMELGSSDAMMKILS